MATPDHLAVSNANQSASMKKYLARQITNADNGNASLATNPSATSFSSGRVSQVGSGDPNAQYRMESVMDQKEEKKKNWFGVEERSSIPAGTTGNPMDDDKITDTSKQSEDMSYIPGDISSVPGLTDHFKDTYHTKYASAAEEKKLIDQEKLEKTNPDAYTTPMITPFSHTINGTTFTAPGQGSLASDDSIIANKTALELAREKAAAKAANPTITTAQGNTSYARFDYQFQDPEMQKHGSMLDVMEMQKQNLKPGMSLKDQYSVNMITGKPLEYKPRPGEQKFTITNYSTGSTRDAWYNIGKNTDATQHQSALDQQQKDKFINTIQKDWHGQVTQGNASEASYNKLIKKLDNSKLSQKKKDKLIADYEKKKSSYQFAIGSSSSKPWDWGQSMNKEPTLTQKLHANNDKPPGLSNIEQAQFKVLSGFHGGRMEKGYEMFLTPAERKRQGFNY